MIRKESILQVKPEALDMPFGLASALQAQSSGSTGGVTEAVLRHLVNSNKAEDWLNNQFHRSARRRRHQGSQGKLGEREVKIAVAVYSNGLSAWYWRRKQEKCTMISWKMACKRGCIAGGGSLPIGPEQRKARLEGLYKTTQWHRSNCTKPESDR